MTWRRARWAALGALLLATACRQSPQGGPVTAGVVSEVVDGDTVVLELDGQRVTVRLLGVDTPETVHPDRPVECWGPEASALLHDLLPVGSPVGIARDAEARDPYDRLLLYLLDADGELVNEQLVAAGAASVLLIEPNGALGARLRAAEAAARAADAGLWGTCGGPTDP